MSDKCRNCGHDTDDLNYFNGEWWCDMCIEAFENPKTWGETENKSQQERIAELEGILSGDPNLTATKEQREAWRLSAVRYADKLETQITALTRENETLREMVERANQIEFRESNFVLSRSAKWSVYTFSPNSRALVSTGVGSFDDILQAFAELKRLEEGK